MSREALVENISAMLQDAGFTVSNASVIRPKSFDLAARRGKELVLLKILANIDALDSATGGEMRRLGTYLDATPMLLGLRTRDDELKPGVVYFRHGVPVLSPDTAMDLFVEGHPPQIYAAPGGLYVNIDSEVLADIRQEEGMSLGQLANEIGVSRRTISKYEDGMNASIEIASRLEEYFEAPLTSPIRVLHDTENIHEADPPSGDPEAAPEDEVVVSVLNRAGFRVHPTHRAPFTAVGEDEYEAEGRIITGHSSFTTAAEKRARIMSSLGEVIQSRSVYFVDRAKRKAIGSTVILEREEADAVSDRDEFRDLVEDRIKESARED